ncbi:MAG: Rrf2 family transcriptional regulator [Bdellovibrionota bacterium]
MIRINRTTEYGLIALQHMSRKPLNGITSAREIADCYGLPFEITAKTLQRLKDTDLIESAQGAKGGYILKRPLLDITLAKFLELMEGKQSLVACCDRPMESEMHRHGSCGYRTKCEISIGMKSLNAKVLNLLNGICLAELSGISGGKT